VVAAGQIRAPFAANDKERSVPPRTDAKRHRRAGGGATLVVGERRDHRRQQGPGCPVIQVRN